MTSQQIGAEQTARIIRALLEAGDRSTAFRMLLNYNGNLAAAVGWNRLRLALPSPQTTGDPVWDAAIAGVTEYRLNQVPMPSPQWVDGIGVSSPTMLAGGPSTRSIDHVDVPAELLKRNVLIETITLDPAGSD